jgi:hypothetical protein
VAVRGVPSLRLNANLDFGIDARSLSSDSSHSFNCYGIKVYEGLRTLSTMISLPPRISLDRKKEGMVLHPLVVFWIVLVPATERSLRLPLHLLDAVRILISNLRT